MIGGGEKVKGELPVVAGVALLANAPERLPDKKKVKREESSVDPEPAPANDRVSQKIILHYSIHFFKVS